MWGWKNQQVKIRMNEGECILQVWCWNYYIGIHKSFMARRKELFRQKMSVFCNWSLSWEAVDEHDLCVF